MLKQRTYDEKELVSMLCNKEEKGMHILYEYYSAAMFGIVVRIVKSDQVAEDVLQDSFIKIWENIERYDPSKGRLFTWVLKVTRNLALDYFKSKQYQNSLRNFPGEIMQFVVDSKHNTQVNTDTIGVQDILGKLKPDYKKIIDMAYFGGYTQVEIATALSIPLGTVKTSTRSAMNQLRQMVA